MLGLIKKVEVTAYCKKANRRLPNRILAAVNAILYHLISWKKQMTLTLLLDLDDTLLSNDIDTFLPAYLKALGKHLIDYVAPDKMVQNLLAATQVMLSNNSATLSLEHSFDQAFYPAIGRTKAGTAPDVGAVLR